MFSHHSAGPPGLVVHCLIPGVYTPGNGSVGPSGLVFPGGSTPGQWLYPGISGGAMVVSALRA